MLQHAESEDEEALQQEKQVGFGGEALISPTPFTVHALKFDLVQMFAFPLSNNPYLTNFGGKVQLFDTVVSRNICSFFDVVLGLRGQFNWTPFLGNVRKKLNLDFYLNSLVFVVLEDFIFLFESRQDKHQEAKSL